MKLGHCELRENGALDFTLIGPGNVVLRNSSSISRCTNTWLEFERVSQLILEEMRMMRRRSYWATLAARGTNPESLLEVLDPRD